RGPCREVHRGRLSFPDQLEPEDPNGRKMRAAGNCTHFMARQCEFPSHVTANRPGAEYADLHRSLLCLSSSDRHIEPPCFGEYPKIRQDIFPFFAIIRLWISSRRCGCSLRLGMREIC